MNDDETTDAASPANTRQTTLPAMIDPAAPLQTPTPSSTSRPPDYSAAPSTVSAAHSPSIAPQETMAVSRSQALRTYSAPGPSTGFAGDADAASEAGPSKSTPRAKGAPNKRKAPSKPAREASKGVTEDAEDDENFDDDGQDDGGKGDGGPKRKRRRQALSCIPCKRRKIRCDRKHPCTPCTKRNDQSQCLWSVVETVAQSAEPPGQSIISLTTPYPPYPAPPPQAPAQEPSQYVLRSEYDELKATVSRLESIVTTLTSGSTFVSSPAPHTPYLHGHSGGTSGGSSSKENASAEHRGPPIGATAVAPQEIYTPLSSYPQPIIFSAAPSTQQEAAPPSTSASFGTLRPLHNPPDRPPPMLASTSSTSSTPVPSTPRELSSRNRPSDSVGSAETLYRATAGPSSPRLLSSRAPDNAPSYSTFRVSTPSEGALSSSTTYSRSQTQSTSASSTTESIDLSSTSTSGPTPAEWDRERDRDRDSEHRHRSNTGASSTSVSAEIVASFRAQTQTQPQTRPAAGTGPPRHKPGTLARIAPAPHSPSPEYFSRESERASTSTLRGTSVPGAAGARSVEGGKQPQQPQRQAPPRPTAIASLISGPLVQTPNQIARKKLAQAQPHGQAVASSSARTGAVAVKSDPDNVDQLAEESGEDEDGSTSDEDDEDEDEDGEGERDDGRARGRYEEDSDYDDDEDEPAETSSQHVQPHSRHQSGPPSRPPLLRPIPTPLAPSSTTASGPAPTSPRPMDTS